MSHAYPAGHVLYRNLNRTFPRIVRGEGCWLFDDTGKRYLDACSGAFVSNLGHGVDEVAQAMSEQARRLAYVNGTAFTHTPVEELSAEIAHLCPGDLDKVLFLCSGADAVEAGLKLARQYWADAGKPHKHKVLALSPSYHGSTLLALSASARKHYQRRFEGWLVDIPKIPAPYPYRCACRGGDGDCPACSGEVLEQTVLREGPETVAAFIAEPIGGTSTGASVPRPDYFKTIREICDRHEILFIADEILTGAGRTGTWSALEPFGVVPDVLLLGKGIAAGFAPLAALVTSERILDVVARGSGALSHAQTFAHHPVSCAAGLATLRLLKDQKPKERGQILHRRMNEGLKHPVVGDIRGRGLLVGVELVRDPHGRTPFPRRFQMAETVTETAREMGLVIWPGTGQADGIHGDVVMIAPPFIITEEEIEWLVDVFRQALEKTMATMDEKGLA